jgi:hypothetical protein
MFIWDTTANTAMGMLANVSSFARHPKSIRQDIYNMTTVALRRCRVPYIERYIPGTMRLRGHHTE